MVTFYGSSTWTHFCTCGQKHSQLAKRLTDTAMKGEVKKKKKKKKKEREVFLEYTRPLSKP
jgi:hypothetical protein